MWTYGMVLQSPAGKTSAHPLLTNDADLSPPHVDSDTWWASNIWFPVARCLRGSVRYSPINIAIGSETAVRYLGEWV